MALFVGAPAVFLWHTCSDIKRHGACEDHSYEAREAARIAGALRPRDGEQSATFDGQVVKAKAARARAVPFCEPEALREIDKAFAENGVR